MQNLTVRLEMVFEQVRSAVSGTGDVRVIDVGSDHGYLALRCLEEGVAKKAVCTEIHEGPAKRSQEALDSAGYSDCSEVHVTDGLIGVPLQDNDVIVIAGMGGLNIIDIIGQAIKDNGTEAMKKVTFVLQPQKSNEIVRKYLAETGFVYVDETVCYDRDIFYNCMRVVYKQEMPHFLSAINPHSSDPRFQVPHEVVMKLAECLIDDMEREEQNQSVWWHEY